MKKKLFTLVFLLLCLSLSAYGTIAYFTAEDTATNVITAGNIKINLQELAVSGEEKSTVPFVDVTGVMPGMEISKIVQVENTGDQPAYVRIKLNKAILLADGVQSNTGEGLITMDINTDCWMEQDGYYYYREPLAAGKTTSPLFTEVSFSKEMGDLYQNSQAVITVNADATQARNNGDNAVTANGWPT